MAYFYSDSAPQGFGSLFRLLDDFDSYNRQQQGGGHRHQKHRGIPTFQPRFDVRELEDSYELHGELPGMKKEEVEIQFTDNQTMLIRGHIEREYEAGTRPSAFLEGSSSGGAITEQGEEHEAAKKQPHKATVEDEVAEGSAATPDSSASPGPAGDVAKQDKKPKAKYWVSERSIGSFSRSFNFPGHIDQTGVKASFKDGILSITVPKAKKPEAFRVAIN